MAGLVKFQNSGQLFSSRSFDDLTLIGNLTRLWSEFGFVFFIKVVLLCLNFPMVQKQVIWISLHKVIYISHLRLPIPLIQSNSIKPYSTSSWLKFQLQDSCPILQFPKLFSHIQMQFHAYIFI